MADTRASLITFSTAFDWTLNYCSGCKSENYDKHSGPDHGEGQRDHEGPHVYDFLRNAPPAYPRGVGKASTTHTRQESFSKADTPAPA